MLSIYLIVLYTVQKSGENHENKVQVQQSVPATEPGIQQDKYEKQRTV